jgi:quercetin dioxygenase-like cupin family protein
MGRMSDTYDRRFFASYTSEIEWQTEDSFRELPPPGPEVKILRRFPEDDDALDVLVRFPRGYVEPRHTHEGEHMVVILEGRVVVDGKTLGPGDYVYGPRNEPHGPFEYPDGVLLYAAHRGPTSPRYD